MPEFGPVGRTVFETHLAGDGATGTHHARQGAEFGVFGVGGHAVATATKPLVVPPPLGFERAARFAFDRLVNGVAVSGLRPTHLSVNFTLPPETTDEQFETVWATLDARARDCGVSVVTGHTGRYEGCAYPVFGSGTALAVGDGDDVVRPDGASAGDRIVVTAEPAIGATGLLAGLDESTLRGELDPATVDAATSRLADVSIVRDALTAATAGPVTAMCAADEGGVVRGLFEMACAADARFEVETNPVPIPADVGAVCDHAGIDPWTAFGAGALLLTVEESGLEDVLAALDEEGIPAAVAGTVVEGSGLAVDGTERDNPDTDPVWDTLARP